MAAMNDPLAAPAAATHRALRARHGTAASAYHRGAGQRPARCPQPGREPDSRAQLQHRVAGRRAHRAAGHQPHDHHAARGRLRGGADGQAAVPADRRAQGPGPARRGGRGARAGAHQGEGHEPHPRRRAQGRGAVQGPDPGYRQRHGHRRAQRHRAGDRLPRRAAARLRDPGDGAHGLRGHVSRLRHRRCRRHPSGRHRAGRAHHHPARGGEPADAREDVLRQRRRRRRRSPARPSRSSAMAARATRTRRTCTSRASTSWSGWRPAARAGSWSRRRASRSRTWRTR